MANSGQPEFFEQTVRLEAEMQMCEEMKQARAGNLLALSTMFKEDIMAFGIPNHNHAVLVFKNPANIFKAIETLKFYIKDVEKYNFSTGLRRKVLELESFASFFEVIQNAKEPESVELTEEQIKEIKIDSWVSEWGQTKAKSITTSKILMYLHMKTFEHLVSQNVLTQKQMGELLGKLNELAERPNLGESLKTVLKHMVEKSTLKIVLREAVDGEYFNFSSQISEFIGKVQSFSASQQPSPTKSLAQSLGDSRIPDSSRNLPKPTRIQDSSHFDHFSDSRMEESSSQLVSSLKESSLADLALTPIRQSSSSATDGFSANPEPQPEADPLSADVQAAQFRMEASAIGAIKSVEQKPSYFAFDQVMHVKKLFGNSRFFSSVAGIEELSKKSVDFQTAKGQFDACLQNFKLQEYEDFMASRSLVKGMLPLHHSTFKALAPIEKLDLLVFQKDLILKRLGGTTCKQDPLYCRNFECAMHSRTWNVFCKLYDELFVHQSEAEQKTKPPLSLLLKYSPLTKFMTRQLVMERLLPFILLHHDDLEDRLDAHLMELTEPGEGTKNEIWFIKAQITIMHLKKGVQPQQYETKERILKFIENYLRFSGEYYLGGKDRVDYQEDFLQCCGAAERLVGQKKFLNFQFNIGNNLQFLYGVFLDFVVSGISPSIPMYQQTLGNLILSHAGSPSLKSTAIKVLKQDSGTLSEFLEDFSRKSQKPVSPQLLDQWLSRLKQATLPDASEALLVEDPALLEAFEALRFLQTQTQTAESAQLLRDVSTLLQHRYQAALKQPATLAAVISRLEHKEHYLKFFSDAAEASSAFKAVFREDQLKQVFEQFRLLGQQQTAIHTMFVALEELHKNNMIGPLSKEYEAFKNEMKAPSKLKVDRLLEIYKMTCENNKKVEGSLALSKVDFYKALLKQRCGRSNLPLDEYRTVCQETEDEICRLLSADSPTMDVQQYLLLKKLVNDGNSVDKISEILMLDKDVRKTLVKFSFYRLLTEFKQIEAGFASLKKAFKFITDESQVLDTFKTLHERFMKDKIINFTDKGVKALLQSALSSDGEPKSESDQEDAAALRIFCKDIDLVCNMGNIKKLFDQFGSKENSHFNNLTFSRSLSATSLDKKQIDKLEAFMGFMKKLSHEKKPKTFELREWVRFISTKFQTSKHQYYKEKFFMSELVAQAELLIEVSKNLLNGVEKGPDEMKRILQKSRIIFNSSEAAEYSVFALTPNLAKRDFVEEEHKLKPNLINQMLLRELNSIKTQMAITQSNQTKQPIKQEPADHFTIFIRLVDSVISIKESLEGITALGLVYDLDGQIKKEIESAKFQGSRKPTQPRSSWKDEEEHLESDDQPEISLKDTDQSKSEDADFSSIKDNVVVNGFDLRISLEAQGSEPPNIAHFIALQKILADILRTGRDRMVGLGTKFHQITRLTGRQKLLLCKYFYFDSTETTIGSAESSDEIFLSLSEVADSLCMFSVEQVVPPLARTAKVARANSKQGVQDRFYLTLDILEHVFAVNNIINQATDATDAPIVDVEPGTLGKCLYYYPTDANCTVEQLLQVLCYNQSLAKDNSGSKSAEHASRFFLTKESTTSQELYQFIVRVAQDSSEVFYYILDLHLLTAEVAQTFLHDLQEVFFTGKPRTCNYKLAMLIKDNSESSLLLPEFQKSNHYYRSLRLDMVNHEKKIMSDKVDLLKKLRVKIVESEQAGMGKSTFVAQKAIEANRGLITINLSGDVSPDGTMRRVAIIKEMARKSPDTNKVLHIKLDMVENFEDNSQIIDQFLFEVCYLRCLPFQNGYIFLDNVEEVFLEVQNTCKKAYYEKISFLRSVKNTENCLHTIPKLKTLDDLKQRLKVNYWSDTYQEDCGILCIILKNLNSFAKLVPTTSTEDSVGRFLDGKNFDSFDSVLAELLDLYVVQEGKKQFNELTFVLIRSWVCIINHQLRSAHNLTNLNLFWQEKELHPKMSALRLSIFKTLIACSVKITWGAAKYIVKQNEEVTDVVSGLKEKPDSVHQLLKLYQSNVKEIPEWIDSKLVNYLPVKDGLTLIYSSIKDVPPEIIRDMTELSGTKLIDYDTVPNGNETLFENLCLSLRANPDVANMKLAANKYQGKGFRLTQETYAKILMIYQQAELNVPIVIMGPSGCGKTYMVSFIAECLLEDHFTNLTLHPGVTEERLKDNLLKCYHQATKAIEAADRANAKAKEESDALNQTWKAALAEWERTQAANPGKKKPIEPPMPAVIKPKRVWLLFDEFNTSHLQCLVAEIMVTRSATFHKDLLEVVFPPNLVFVACCNPYKIEVPKESKVGLAKDAKSGLLAHRVYPIPDTLIGYVWKFGVIKDKDEVEHIRPEIQNINFARQFKIVNRKLASDIQTNIIMTITTCQRFFRKSGNENSVSLRDVGRFIKMFTFLMSHFQSVNVKLREADGSGHDEIPADGFELYDALIVATQYCYILRLDTFDERTALMLELRQRVPVQHDYEGRFLYVLDLFAKEIKDRLDVSLEHAALNRPLKENLLVLWMCLLLKIPLLICGKPGTSKTLSINIIAKAFNIELSKKAQILKEAPLRFFGTWPAVIFRNFWGTETTTSESVDEAFDETLKAFLRGNPHVAAQYEQTTAAVAVRAVEAQGEDQQDMEAMSEDTVVASKQAVQTFASQLQPKQQPQPSAAPVDQPVALVFDEIGLSEISKDNPLKVLHPWLEPSVATLSFIGLSNWKLDASKMNRLLYVARPDMTTEELVATCESRTKSYQKSSQKLKPYFTALAESYVKFREQQASSAEGHNNFHGARDFYSTISMFTRLVESMQRIDDDLDKDVRFPEAEGFSQEDRYYLLMRFAIQRSFAGIPKTVYNKDLQDTVELFEQKVKHVLRCSKWVQESLPRLPQILRIYHNLKDLQARHLMIFTASTGIEDIIVEKIREFQLEQAKLEPRKFVYLSQKRGRDEMIRLVMTQLPVYTKNGYTIVMKDMEDVYGCMYDLLNKNYFKEGGKNRCKLFYEGHEDIVEVSDQFKIVLLMKEIKETLPQKDLEQQLPAPLLNRFEKYTLSKSEFMTESQIEEYDKLTEMFDPTQRKRFRLTPLGVVHNLSDELLLSVIMTSHGSNVSALNSHCKGAFDSEESAALKVLVDQTKVATPAPKDLRRTSIRTEAPLVSLNDQSLSKLAPLFSRNLIIMKALSFSKNEYYNIDGDEFQQLFLDYHPYDSLWKLVEAMSKEGVQHSNKMVVFTYSPSFQVHQIVRQIELKTTNRFDLKEASSLHQLNDDSQGMLIQKLMSDPSKILIVYFKGRKDWKLMQHLRYSIRTTPGADDKKVIFTAHYAPQDIATGLKISSPISFFSEQWTMVGIDDLSFSNYEMCFDALEVPVDLTLKKEITVLTKGSKEEYLTGLARQALTEFIKNSPLLRSSFEKSQRVIDMLIQRHALMQYLNQQLEEELAATAAANEESEETPSKLVLDLLKQEKIHKGETKHEVDYLNAFDAGNDLYATLGERLTVYMSERFHDILDQMIKFFPFELISKAALLQSSQKMEFLKHFEEVALRKIPLNPSIEERILSSQLQESMFRMKFKNHIEALKGLVKDLHAGKPAAISQFNRRFGSAITDPASIKVCIKRKAPDEDEVFLPFESSLTALFIMEKFYRNKTSYTEAIHCLLLQTTEAYLQRIELADAAKDTCMLTMGVMLLGHVFQEELEVLSLYFSQFGMNKLGSQIAKATEAFTNKGVFDIAKCADDLFAIQSISGPSDLREFISKFEAGIRLSKRIPRVLGSANTNAKEDSASLSREIFLSILNWIDHTENQAEFNSVKNMFNQAKKKLDSKQVKGLSGLCIELLEGLLTQTQSPFSSVRLIVDSTLGNYFSVVTEQTSTEGLVRLVSLLSERIIRDPDASMTVRPIVLLAKVITFANLDQAKRDEVIRRVNEKFTSSNPFMDDVLQQIIASLNFQLVNSHKQVEHTDSRISAAKYFQDNQLSIIQNMTSQDLKGKILENQQIKSLQALKKLITSWKVGDANQDTQEKRALENLILRGLEKKEPRAPYLGGLLLLQVIYVTINDVNKLRAIGLEQLAKKMNELMTDESKGFMLPGHDRYIAVRELRKQVLQASDVMADTFDKRFEIFNMVYVDSYKDQERMALLASMTATPRYQEFVRAVMAAGIPQQAGGDMDFYHLIGIAANIAESARDSFVYSKTKLATNFSPLINWEGPTDRMMLKLLHLKQTTSYSYAVDPNSWNTIWTKVYRCTEPSCRYLIPVANCGKFGYHTGEANTTARCLGTCGRIVGDYNQDSSKYLVEVTIPQMEAEIVELLKHDEQAGSFKAEDASNSCSTNALANFEEDWILRKYKQELKDRNSAAFVYLVQHIFALVWKIYSGPTTIQLPPDSNIMALLKRDIELLRHMLQKDHTTTMNFLILFFDKMQRDAGDGSKPSLDTPAKLRIYLSAQMKDLMSNFTAKLEDYNHVRSNILGQATEQRLQILNYLNGNLTAESMEKVYPELILPTIWLKPAQSFEERPIEEFLVQEKDKKNLQAAFILDLLSKRNYLHQIRPILVSICRLADLLGKKYDQRFTREETVAFQDVKRKIGTGNMDDDIDGEMDTEQTSETTYKLNLDSILDNSYFRGSLSPAPLSTKPTRSLRAKVASKAHADDEETQSNYVPEDIKKEFASFCVMMKNHLKPLIETSRDDLETRLKLGCESASIVIQALLNLGNSRRSPLVGYVFPNTTGLDEIDQPLVSLKTLVEGLLGIQLELISNYREEASIVPFMPALPQTPRKFLDCTEEHFMYLDPQQMIKDLKAAAYCELHAGMNNTRIAVDLQMVTKKWADILFSEAERISVTFNLNFNGQEASNLFDLCKRLTRDRNIEMETNMEEVAYADDHLKGNMVLELENVLLKGLDYVLTHVKQVLRGDTALWGLLPQELKQIAIPKLLKLIKLRDCELLRTKVLIFGYASTLSKLLKKPEFSDKFEKKGIPKLNVSKFREILGSKNDRAKKGILKKMADDVKIFWSTFINDTTLQKDAYLEIVERPVLEIVSDNECGHLISSTQEWVVINEETTLIQFPRLVDRLEQELEKCETSEDEDSQNQNTNN